MKKILIACDYFYPSNVMGAVRPSKIAKKLKADGYVVDVFTRHPVDNDSEKYCNNLYSFEKRAPQNVSESHIKSGGSNFIKSFLLKKIPVLYRLLYRIKIFFDVSRKDGSMLRAFKRFVHNNDKEYDVIFTTFGPLGSLLCGLYYKKKNPNVKWICDFRDPAVVSQVGLLRKILLYIKEQQACRMADEIVTVSNGYLERICGDKYKDKCHMIPNGYDTDDMIYSVAAKENTKTLQLVYVGYLYGQMRDISPIFKALKELSEDGLIDLNNVSFNYAGTDYMNLIKQSEPFGMSGIVINHGVLSREDCLKLQFMSDLLVLSTWNTKKEYGVFPGKLLEYMLIGKPIVTTVSGDMPNSEVSQVINEGDLGVVYEEINGDKDFGVLKSYLLSQYNHKVSGTDVDFSPNPEVLKRYEYSSVIAKIKSLIEE